MKIGARPPGYCVAFAALGLGLASCTGAASPPRGGPFQPTPTTIDTIKPNALCSKARASEELRPRADVTSLGGQIVVAPQVVHTSDLFVRFNAICGACHVEASTQGKHITEETFADVFDATWLAPIKADEKFMPPAPNGKPYSTRTATDPVVVLVKYLEAWMAAGKPRDVFSVDAEMAATAVATSNYTFLPAVAAAFTNLGNCVTNAAGFETSQSGMMESMDELFAGAEELPPTLAETDLTTFDSEILATTGVIAYVPTYPLWSAGSGKLRHVRVPRGQHVTFDKAAQTFTIPPNTRFYKTFFRKVIDRAGRETTRKMETRVIVARPDVTLTDGTVKQTALFGTYIWSEDETTATLANLPYRDGTPFADQVRTYITDELAYQDVVDSVGPGANFEAGLQAALARALERNPNLQQHYAIPGRVRCVQCHMGSPTRDFVLGFFPLQVARRANGTGGTYEPTGEDELTQLQRLIDYGVISGMTSPADVLPLEQSQGTRKPRTDGELTAQAYIVGNCAHCHNPRGLPSVTKPDLATALNFLPDGKDGGVFEFSLERMSPIRQRGANGDIPIPYITPSLRDYPVVNSGFYRIDNGQPLFTDTGGEVTWTPKYPQNPALRCEDLTNPNAVVGDVAMLRAYCGKKRTGFPFVPAPWRSLIYRNVDSPFPYFDDYVPYPHMPMNTFGFDCRAPRIMGDWMVGLPAERKYPAYPENVIPGDGAKPDDGSYDSRPQPYQEIKPDDPRYPMALSAAQARLSEYHDGVRYGYCEDVLSPDIYDPVDSLLDVKGYHPAPDRFVYGGQPPHDPTRPTEYAQPPIGVPYHSHFFPYDPTDPPPPWSPRRPDWTSLLVDRMPDVSPPAGSSVLTPDEAHARKILVDTLNEPSLTPSLQAALQKYATTEIPYGLWQQKPGCDKLAVQPKAGDFTGAARPAWMNKVNPPADAPVYMATPGSILYAHICVNCHGPKADGKGLQADALAASSEGEARPANFREGLFGPSAQPGTNLISAFGMGNADVATRWAPRYMAWMALGGTLKKIPQDIVHQVEATKVFGQQRPNLHHLLGAEKASANMLKLAAGLCAILLPDDRSGHYYAYQQFMGGLEPQFYPPFNATDTPFLDTIADREMWMQLCTQYSPTVVRVYGVLNGFSPPSSSGAATGDVGIVALYYGDKYPANAPVLDQNKQIQMGLQADKNLYPACFKPSTDAQEAAWVAGTAIKTKLHMPDCPAGFLENPADPSKVDPAQTKIMWTRIFQQDWMRDNVARWSLRGAVATGIAVYSHLRSGGAQAETKPYYNQCQLLK